MDTIFFDFLARRNSISVSRKRIFQRMLYFFQRLLLEEAFFLSSGKLFFNESFIPAIGEGFYSLMETINLLEKIFSTSGKRHCYEWKPISKDRTYSCWWKLTLWMVETIFFYCLIHFSKSTSSQLAETHFSVQKNSIVFYSELSSLPVKTII